jgi:hypothetical protein
VYSKEFYEKMVGKYNVHNLDYIKFKLKYIYPISELYTYYAKGMVLGFQIAPVLIWKHCIRMLPSHFECAPFFHFFGQNFDDVDINLKYQKWLSSEQ